MAIELFRKPKLPATTLLCSAIGFEPQSKDDCLAAWNDGRQWKMWQGPPTSVHNLTRIRMSGWTHVCFVFQRSDGTVDHAVLELSSYKPPAGVV